MEGGRRFGRLESDSWADIGKVRGARVLVAGVGALGNETVKDLALLSFRHIVVADPGVVSEPDLGRCLFFRERDVGRKKAEVVAARVKEMCPAAAFTPDTDTIQKAEGWNYDVVLGSMGSVHGRIYANSRSKMFRVPYVDAVVDGFRGRLQVVLPDGPCLECGMSRSKESPPAPDARKPADATTVAVLAGMQAREALKIACRRSDLCVKGVIYYDGISGRVEVLGMGIDRACPNHVPLKHSRRWRRRSAPCPGQRYSWPNLPRA